MANVINQGATPAEQGYRFTLWAPHAEAVSVIGSFNDWDSSSNPMVQSDTGWWSTSVPGVKPGDEYRYSIITAGQEYLRIDPYARRVTDSAGNAIIMDTSCQGSLKAKFTPSPLDEMVIYELHIGTFGKQSGSKGPGDLETAIARLSYLKELGINAVEIMPLAEFAGGYSWGYNPSHIFAVESDYGAPCTFRDFVEEAHRLEIAVIVDVVYNHFGPTDLNLWQFDGWQENGKGGIYFYNDWRAQTPWGETRPDYGRQEVRDFLRDNALMWFAEYGVDGLRWDMTAFIRNVHGRNNDPGNDLNEGWSLMQWLNQEIRKYWGRALTIAEDLQNNSALIRAVTDGGAGFDAQWAAPFVHAIRSALIQAEDGQRDMGAVRDAIQHNYDLKPFTRVIYTESHDEVANGKARVPEEVDPGSASSWAARKKSALGAVLVFSSPGIPMLFQGQEFLEDDWFHDQDPIDWSKKERFAGILQLYRDLIGLRLNRQGYSRGLCGPAVDVYHVNHNDKLIAFHRWEQGGAGDSVVIIANFSAVAREHYWLGFPAAGTWVVRFNSDSFYYDAEFGNLGVAEVVAQPSTKDGLPAQGTIRIGAYSALILSQSR